MRSEGAMEIMQEEVAKMDALKKEGEVRAATDAEIQWRLDRPTTRYRPGETLDAFLEKLGSRLFGLDKRAVDKDIQREVDTKHIPAEELNARYDTLRERLTQTYEAFEELKGESKKDFSWDNRSAANYFVTEHSDGSNEFTWEYKDKELEELRQQVLMAKKELTDFVNQELYEGSDKDYRQSRKALPFEETLIDIDTIGLG